MRLMLKRASFRARVSNYIDVKKYDAIWPLKLVLLFVAEGNFKINCLKSKKMI